MPPYHIDAGVGIQEIKNDWRLSDVEIETIVSWVDAGTPEGDPADLPEPRAPTGNSHPRRTSRHVRRPNRIDATIRRPGTPWWWQLPRRR